MNAILTAVSAILIFFVVVFVHEFGHFIVAKKNNIKVHEFAIGMGPLIISRTYGETKYSLRALPIGAYVSMEGEDGESDSDRSFGKKSLLARISVVVAGAVMNFILALVIFFVFFLFTGFPTTEIKTIQPKSPAYEAGIKQGDIISEINGVKIEKWEDIRTSLEGVKEKEDIDLSLKRNGKEVDKNINLGKEKLLGITPTSEKSFIQSIKATFSTFKEMITLMFDFIGRLFTGNIKSEEVSGPIGIVYAVNKTMKTGIMNLVLLTGFLSVNLGFFNLLPIPALDGSRLLILIIEGIRGKAMDPEKEGMVHKIGFLVLIGLSLIVMYKDVLRFIL